MIGDDLRFSLKPDRQNSKTAQQWFVAHRLSVCLSVFLHDISNLTYTVTVCQTIHLPPFNFVGISLPKIKRI